MISLSSNIDTLNHGSGGFLVKSWSLPLGKVNLFWVKDGVIRATISRGDGKNSYISNILGLQKHWMSSSAVLTHVLGNAYAILSQSSNREFFLRIAPRVCGGGHGHSKDSSYDDRSDLRNSSERADTKQSISSDRDTTDPSARPESQKGKDTTPDKQEISSEKQKSDHSNQGASEEGAQEQKNPSSSDFHQYSSKNTDPYTLGQAAIDAGQFILGEATGLGTIMDLVKFEELNKGENEWVSEQIVRDLERKGIDISDIQIGVPDPAERHSRDYAQQDYPQDEDRGRFDTSDSRYDMQDRDPVERHSPDYNMREREYAGGGDISDFRDNMRDHAEMYSN